MSKSKTKKDCIKKSEDNALDFEVYYVVIDVCQAIVNAARRLPHCSLRMRLLRFAKKLLKDIPE